MPLLSFSVAKEFSHEWIFNFVSKGLYHPYLKMMAMFFPLLIHYMINDSLYNQAYTSGIKTTGLVTYYFTLPDSVCNIYLKVFLLVMSGRVIL